MRLRGVSLLTLALATASAAAQTPPQNVLRMNGVPSWVLPGASVDLNFAAGQYWTHGATGPLTNTRASVEECVDASGNWHQAASGQNCITNLGISSWEARTNQVWFSDAILSANGYTYTNASTSAAASGPGLGLWYTFDDGTVASAQHFMSVPAQISYNQGATYTYSVLVQYVNSQFVQLTLPSAVFGSNYADFDIVNGTLGSTGGATFASAIQKYSSTEFLLSVSATATASLASTSALINIVMSSSATRLPSYNGAHNQVNIGNIQVEANPNISASVASAVMTASGASGVNGTAVYSVQGGTCATPPTLNVTWAAGVLTVNSVANAGLCSVLPPSPATLAYVSGTATGWTGATVTLTPTNNAAQAFATPPILTSGSAAARAADNISIPIRACGNSLSVLAIGTPAAPTGYPANQQLAEADNGTVANRLLLSRGTSTGIAAFNSTTSGNAIANGVSTWAQNASGKLSGLVAGTLASGVFNNGAPFTATQANGPPPVNELKIGTQFNGLFQFNGVISRVALACGQSLLGN